MLLRLFVRRAAPILLLVALVACAAPPALVPYGGAVEKEQPVYVATSRRAKPGTVPPTFGGERAAHVQFAEYRISIPPDREAGDLHLPEGAPDPARDFLATGYQGLDDQAGFIAAINRQLDPLPANQRTVTLFVHGYNTGFPMSVLRAAQVAEDYRLKGPMVMFSWPSAEKPTHYIYDRDSTLFARNQFVETLQALARTKASSVVILAHSMGGFLTMEGVSRLRDRGDTATLNRISAIIMAEPDIDLDVFTTQVAGIDLRRLGVVVLVSGRDRILRLSQFVAGGEPRLGESKNIEALRRLGVFVVDVSHFDDGTLGQHSAFQRSPELLAMIGSGALTDALETAGQGTNIVVEALNAVGAVAMAIAYIPYELTP